MSRQLKVAFFSYPSSFQNIGGGEILLLKMSEYLQKAGIDVKLFDMWNDKIENFDYLHVFGSVKDCLGLMQVANSRQIKVAITPLFWSSWNRAFNCFGSKKEKMDLILRHTTKVLCPKFPSKRRHMLLSADLIFANSQMEVDQISRLFCVDKSKMRIVYNGTDRKFAEARPDLYRRDYGAEPFILSVGRIEPRKNQLNLIRAAKLINKQLVIIGDAVSGFETYHQACLQEGQGMTRFIPAMDQDHGLLASAYAACDLYVLPAWFETPGMVALESILAGANVASTTGGSTRDYFKDDVDYFDPAKPDSIANAIQKGLKRSVNPEFKKRVMDEFTWEPIAQNTIQYYKEFL